MKLVISALLILTLFLFNSCKTIQTKVDDKTQSELNRMGQYIGHSIESVYVDFGKDGVHSKDYRGYKKVIFTTKKLGVKCKRIFFYDHSMTVSSIKFAGCW